jgi:hypothetical protein
VLFSQPKKIKIKHELLTECTVTWWSSGCEQEHKKKGKLGGGTNIQRQIFALFSFEYNSIHPSTTAVLQDT